MDRPDIDAIRDSLYYSPTREELVQFFRHFGEHPNQSPYMYASMLSTRLVPPIDIEDLLNYIEHLEELRKVEQNALAETVRLLAERGVLTQFTENGGDGE